LVIIKELRDLHKNVVSVRGFNIQNMMVQGQLLGCGAGGNLGVGVAIIVIPIVLALYAALLANASGYMTGTIDWTSLWANNSSGDLLDGMDGGAKYMILRAFPLEFAISLMLAAIIFRLTMMKVYMATAAIKTFLFGS